ncbi:MAG: lytic transglycosylase domain-containing protein [Vampirovibrio sp.]
MTQLMPKTSDWLNELNKTNLDPNKAEDNLQLGLSYLHERAGRYGSLDITTPLAAYNGGDFNMRKSIVGQLKGTASRIPYWKESRGYFPAIGKNFAKATGQTECVSEISPK